MPKLPRTKSGASDLAGFIEAPVIGAAQSPARAIYPPTAIAPLVPMLRAPDAVPRIVFTNPAVSTTSIASAFPPPTPLPGMVAPSSPIAPNPQEERRRDTTDHLGEDVARHPAPREVTPHRECQGDGGIQMGSTDCAHKVDDRHYHEPGRNHHHAQGYGSAALNSDDPAAC